MTTTTGLPLLDRAELTGPVRRALHSETVEIVDWHCRPISYANVDEISGGVYHVVGSGYDRGATVSWSLVLKVVLAQARSDDPAGADAWQREVLAYQAGLLDNLLGGVV